MEKQPGEVLTLTNACLVFCEYLRQKEMVPVKRSIFKGMFTPLVREAFNLGLRNDVIDQRTQKQRAGWKDLRVQEPIAEVALAGEA